MSRITAFIGAAVLGMAMMAFAPLAMALDDPPPEICLLDFSQPVDLDTALMTSVPNCAAIDVADVQIAPASTGGSLGEAATAHCKTFQMNALDFAGYRLHVDPGRCVV